MPYIDINTVLSPTSYNRFLSWHKNKQTQGNNTAKKIDITSVCYAA